MIGTSLHKGESAENGKAEIQRVGRYYFIKHPISISPGRSTTIALPFRSKYMPKKLSIFILGHKNPN